MPNPTDASLLHRIIRRLLFDPITRGSARPEFERRLVDQLWHEGLSIGRPWPAAWVVVALGFVATTALLRWPDHWRTALTWAPLLLGPWSVLLGAALGRRWGGAHPGAGTEAESFLSPATRRMRYRVWTIQGLAWAGVLWLIPILPLVAPWYLLRYADASLFSVPTPPIAMAIFHPSLLLLALVIAFRRAINATTARSYRRAAWPALAFPGMAMLLIDLLPRLTTVLWLDHPIWGLGLPFLAPAPAWLVSLVAVALLALARREDRLGLADYARKDAVAQPLASSGALRGPTSAATRFARPGLIALVMALPFLFARSSPAMRDLHRYSASSLAITERHGGSFTGRSLVEGSVAYLAEADGLGAYDIADPAKPRQIGWVSLTYDGNRPVGDLGPVVPQGDGIIAFATRYIDGRNPHRLRRMQVKGATSASRGSVRGRERDTSFSGLAPSVVRVAGRRFGLFLDFNVDAIWVANGALEIHELDPAFPHAVHSLRKLDLAESGLLDFEWLLTDAEASPLDPTKDRLLAVRPFHDGDPGSHDVAIVNPAPGIGTMDQVEGGISIPEGSSLLAIHRGHAYVLHGDDVLEVGRLIGEPPFVGPSRLASLDLPQAPSRHDKPARHRQAHGLGLYPHHFVPPLGEIRDGRLVFIRPLSRVLTVVDIETPDAPRLVGAEGDHHWTGEVHWGPRGLIGAFSADGTPESEGSLTWRLLHLGSAGLEALGTVSRPNVVGLVETSDGAWAQSLRALPRPLEAVLDGSAGEDDATPDASAQPPQLGGRSDGIPFWIQGQRVVRVDNDSHRIVVSDLDGGHAVELPTPKRDLHDMEIRAATTDFVVLSDLISLHLLDIRDPGHERVVLDWQAPDPVGDDQFDNIHWTGLHGAWLLALLPDASLIVWSLDSPDAEPKAIRLDRRVLIPNLGDPSRATPPISDLVILTNFLGQTKHWLRFDVAFSNSSPEEDSRLYVHDERRHVLLDTLPEPQVYTTDTVVSDLDITEAERRALEAVGALPILDDPSVAPGRVKTQFSWNFDRSPGHRCYHLWHRRAEGLLSFMLPCHPWTPRRNGDDGSVDVLDVATAPDGRLVLRMDGGRLFVAEPYPLSDRRWDALWGRRIHFR